MPRLQIKRPAAHHMIIASYVATPFFNALLLAVFMGLPFPAAVQRIVAGYGPLVTAWLVTAPLAGLSLYFLNRVSWYVFLAHAGIILVDSVLKLALRPAAYFAAIPRAPQMLFLAGNLVRLTFVGFVLQKDFRAPYFQILQRRFRGSRRIPLSLPILLDGEPSEVSDMSSGGCFVARPPLRPGLGERVRVSFVCDGATVSCSGQVMRRTPGGLGVRFLGLTRDGKRCVRRMLKVRAVPRTG